MSIETVSGVGRVKVLNNGGSGVTRRAINFIPGSGMGVTTADNPTSDRVDVTLTPVVASLTQNGIISASRVFDVTADVTVVNTVTETTILGTVTGSKSLPSLAWNVGSTFRFKAYGKYQVTGAGSSFLINLYAGSTVVAAINVPNLTAAASVDLYWEIEAVITCRITGAGGSVEATGRLLHTNDDTATADAPSVGVSIPALTSVDLSVNNNFDAKITWGAADPANTFTCTNATMEFI